MCRGVHACAFFCLHCCVRAAHWSWLSSHSSCGTAAGLAMSNAIFCIPGNGSFAPRRCQTPVTCVCCREAHCLLVLYLPSSVGVWEGTNPMVWPSFQRLQYRTYHACCWSCARRGCRQNTTAFCCTVPQQCVLRGCVDTPPHCSCLQRFLVMGCVVPAALCPCCD